MAMFRRSPKSPSALRRRQEEIEKREAELREKVEKLERMVINGPQSAEDTSPAPGEGRRKTNNTADKQLHVSVALEDRHYFDKSGSRRRPRSLRKERRQGPDGFSAPCGSARRSGHLADEPSALLTPKAFGVDWQPWRRLPTSMSRTSPGWRG